MVAEIKYGNGNGMVYHISGQICYGNGKPYLEKYGIPYQIW
jgi:hypothetical protein